MHRSAVERRHRVYETHGEGIASRVLLAVIKGIDQSKGYNMWKIFRKSQNAAPPSLRWTPRPEDSVRSARWSALLTMVILLVPAQPVWAWGKGHRLIRLWAVARLPEWQREWVGQEHLDRLCRDYTSLQDRHAGGNAPELDPYCIVPDVRVSLHDVNPAEASFQAKRWYLKRIMEHLQDGHTDEAMKFLGVLCHWNEDPGCPSAHSSPVSERQLKRLIPPPKDKENLNFLYGYGGIADIGTYVLPEEDYRPRLLGGTIDEAVARIYQHQRILESGAAARIVPLVQAVMAGDTAKADEQRAAAALDNARHVADVIYTVLCLASKRIDEEESAGLATQPLTDWEPEFAGGNIGHPYYVSPFLVNQAMDADRRLLPLALPGEANAGKIEHGYGMGAPFTLKFTIAPGGVFDRLTCQVGLHPAAGDEGEVTFVVLANGEELHRTGPIRSGEQAEKIDIRLPQTGVLKLSLQTVPSNAAASKQNLTVWADPVLHRNGR